MVADESSILLFSFFSIIYFVGFYFFLVDKGLLELSCLLFRVDMKMIICVL